jgi:TRAP-type C4-dicarboxylate transport system permease large subunit
MKEILWPVIVMIFVLIVITYVPDVVLFLPRAVGMIR